MSERDTELFEDVPVKSDVQRAAEMKTVFANKPPALPLHIEGNPKQIAAEVARISPEGTPGDAKAGPGLLAIEVLIALVLLGAASLAMGIWLGWAAGLGMFAIVVLALFLNPSAMAAVLRMGERKQVADQHNHDERRVKVVRQSEFHKPVM